MINASVKTATLFAAWLCWDSLSAKTCLPGYEDVKGADNNLCYHLNIDRYIEYKHFEADKNYCNKLSG